MKILLIQDFLRSGGTEKQTISLCNYFSRSGHDVSLLTFRPGGRLGNGVDCASVKPRSLQPFDMQVNFLAPRLFREAPRANPDIIMCMGRVANSYAGLLQRRLGKAVTVGTARTGKPLPWLNLWSFRRVDAVLANCEWWRNELEAKGVPSSKVKVIHSGLVSSWTRSDDAAVRENARVAQDVGRETVVFLSVAGFRKGKRQAWLIEAFARLGEGLDWRLCLVGDGAERSRCCRIAQKLGVAHRIHMPGFKLDPSSYFSAADVAVSASIEDSLPNFLIEAQSAGLPVIASNVRGVGETFDDGQSGFLVAPNDRAGFISRIEQLCRDGSLRESMGRMAIQIAGKRFSGEKQAAKMLDFFDELANA